MWWISFEIRCVRQTLYNFCEIFVRRSCRLSTYFITWALARNYIIYHSTAAERWAEPENNENVPVAAVTWMHVCNVNYSEKNQRHRRNPRIECQVQHIKYICILIEIHYCGFYLGKYALHRNLKRTSIENSLQSKHVLELDDVVEFVSTATAKKEKCAQSTPPWTQ